MIRGVVSPTLKRWMELFPEIVNCLLRSITKNVWLDVLLGSKFASLCFISYMRLHQLVQYANLTKVKNLN